MGSSLGKHKNLISKLQNVQNSSIQEEKYVPKLYVGRRRELVFKGSFIISGAQLGTALQLLASGFIADSLGWPAIFYINGTLGAIWTVAYVFLGADSPRNSKMISAEERMYIQTSLGHVGTAHKVRIFNWSFHMIQLQLIGRKIKLLNYRYFSSYGRISYKYLIINKL